MSSVAKNASRMGLATFFSRILGLVREQVFAFYFGASDAADSFNIAFRIPNLLRDLFAEGAMSAAFVPNFTRALLESREKAFRLLAAVLSVLLCTVTVIAGIGIIFSPALVSIYAGSFSNVPGKVALTTSLTQLMFPFFPMVAVAAVLMGALNAMGSFFLPAFAPALFNMASILCGIALTPLLIHFTSMPPIYSMAIGVLLGGFLQFYVQWLQVRRNGFLLREVRKSVLHPFLEPGTKQVLWLLVPGTVGLAATQLNILVNSVYATNYGSGAVSWLNYAFRFMQFPIGIFGVSLAAATLPNVTRKLSLEGPSVAGEEVLRSLRLVFAVNGPAAAGLMAIGLPITQAVFQHGRFVNTDSAFTATALFWYAVGLPGYSVVKVVVPVFYALGITRIPVTISFAMVGLNLLLNSLFFSVFHMPFWSLALATSIVATLNSVLLLWKLGKFLPGIVGASLFRALFLHFVVALLIGTSSRWCSEKAGILLEHFSMNPGFILWSVQVVTGVVVALVVWLSLGKIFGIDEIKQSYQVVQRRWKRASNS